MAKHTHKQDEAYVQAAMNGDLGPAAQDAADTAVTAAIVYGHIDEPARVADHIRAELANGS